MNKSVEYPKKLPRNIGKRPKPTPSPPKKKFTEVVKCPECGTQIAIQNLGHIYGPIRTDHKR